MAENPKQTITSESDDSCIATRFNSVRHVVLNRCTVLPWEIESEYMALFDALVGEHKPKGPTEMHLVEELAGIVWRKRRLRLAEASAMREGLRGTTRPHSNTVEAALVCMTGGQCDVGEALRASPEENQDEAEELARARKAAEKASRVLQVQNDEAYELAVKALNADVRDWWVHTVEEWAEEPEHSRKYVATAESLADWLEDEARPFFYERLGELRRRRAVRKHAFGEAFAAIGLERISRYETHLDRKLERTLAMLLRLKELRLGCEAA